MDCGRNIIHFQWSQLTSGKVRACWGPKVWSMHALPVPVSQWFPWAGHIHIIPWQVTPDRTWVTHMTGHHDKHLGGGGLAGLAFCGLVFIFLSEASCNEVPDLCPLTSAVWPDQTDPWCDCFLSPSFPSTCLAVLLPWPGPEFSCLTIAATAPAGPCCSLTFLTWTWLLSIFCELCTSAGGMLSTLTAPTEFSTLPLFMMDVDVASGLPLDNEFLPLLWQATGFNSPSPEPLWSKEVGFTSIELGFSYLFGGKAVTWCWSQFSAWCATWLQDLTAFPWRVLSVLVLSWWLLVAWRGAAAGWRRGGGLEGGGMCAPCREGAPTTSLWRLAGELGADRDCELTWTGNRPTTLIKYTQGLKNKTNNYKTKQKFNRTRQTSTIFWNSSFYWETKKLFRYRTMDAK